MWTTASIYFASLAGVVLIWILIGILRNHPATHLFEIAFGNVSFKLRKGQLMVTMDITQQFTVVVSPVADDGGPGVIDGPPTWATDNPFVSLTPTADGLTCVVKGLAEGTCNVTPSALANSKPISGLPIAITVTAPPPKFATHLAEQIGPVVSQ